MNENLRCAQAQIDRAQALLSTVRDTPTAHEEACIRASLEWAIFHIEAFYKEQQK